MKDLLLWFLFLASGVDYDVVTIRHPAPQFAGDDIPHGVENRGLVCTALAVYAEARGESWFGQALVAQVVVNRQAALGPGADACDVISQPGQFQWNDTWAYPRTPWLEDRIAWDMALDVATAVTSGDYYVPPPCQVATHFRTRASTAPAWTDLKLLCTVGGHDFYVAPTVVPNLTAATATGLSP